MVFLMEGPNARDIDASSSDSGGERTRVDENMDDTSSTLPFEKIDRSLVYHVDELHLTMLASGFFGEIYRAYHEGTDRTMVLKKDRLSVQERGLCENDLMAEAAILSRMCHPNVVRFLGLCIGDEEGQTHLLLEYINGGNLEELLMNHNEVLDWGTRVYLARDIADGMSYLHTRRIIHRDLASKNCLIKVVNGAKYAVVADFGLATYLPDNGQGVQTVVGSPYNMAPELLRGETYDNKADVFSYGIIMCEIIGRVQADPDELPRLGNFGLDVEKFQSMVGDCPMEFLHTAVCCCQMDPRTRPSFAATVKQLELILIDYPRRPEISTEPFLGENNIDSHPKDTVCKSDAYWSTSTTSSSNSASLLSPGYILKDENCHRLRSNSENKRRMSWISRHKLFHSATDDLLKNTPAKLMGFFKDVLGLRSKEMSVAKGRRTVKDGEHGSRSRSQSSILTRISPLPTKDNSQFNYDLNKNKSELAITKQSKSAATVEKPSKSVSCPGTPGSSKRQTSSRRHTISPSSPVYSDIPDFNLSISSETSTSAIDGGKCAPQSDEVSMSSGFASMPDTSSLCTSNNETASFTESDFSSRTSSLRRQVSLGADDEEDQFGTPTCKNIKTPHFDRYGSYSVINAEASSRLSLDKEMEKEKLSGLTSAGSDNVKDKRRLRSPSLLSFLLRNRGKSKDTA